MIKILESLNSKVTFNEDFCKIKTFRPDNLSVSYDLVRKMRASFLILGPLLTRFGKAEVSLPGGCAIGTRPVDLHIEGLKMMGANIAIKDGYVKAKVIGKLRGTEIKLKKISVGATENIMMAASLAQGVTVLTNVAKEPEIIDLADMLNSMGADIKGAGTDEITIKGVNELFGTSFTIPADRIEAGTYLVAAAVTNGSITIDSINPNRLMKVINMIERSGPKISFDDNSISISMNKDRPDPVDITTAPFPEFPTDMQAQFSVINAISSGVSNIYETVFENRFMHILELNRMGCDIEVKGNHAIIKGVESIYGAEVMATDLRASASLILAGLCAKGETVVDRIYHIDRGYERIEEKLNYLGANIVRLPS